jgi:predicted nucleotidyltransferase
MAAILGGDPTNLSRELSRLEREGLLRSEVEGRQRYYSINPGYPYLKPLFTMLRGSVGMIPTLKNSLKHIQGIESAYVYGSFAKNDADASSDIDLLIVGQPDQAALASAVRRAEKTLRREVSYTVLKPQELQRKLKARDPFVTDIWGGKLIALIDHEQNEATAHGLTEGFFKMTTDFQLSILATPQRRLWDELEAVPVEFVLYGGTALALHLGHRKSADYDFFGNRPFDPARLAAKISFLTGATITQQEPNTLTAIIDRNGPVKVSFFGLPGIARLRTPHIAPTNGLQIASLLDLAGTKAAVVQQRAEAKDYLDIDALLQDGRLNLPTALASAKAIYGPSFNPQITLKALSFFGDGNLSRLPRVVQDRLVRAARAVDLDRLPDITVAPGQNNSDRGLSR